jgi:dihydroxy-acid dehydratase
MLSRSIISRQSKSVRRSLHTSSKLQVKEGLNRHSRNVTQHKSQGASQAMLYATDGVETDADLNKAMVGVASVW